MRVWRTPAEVPDDLGRTVVSVGNFDGVHRGHRFVLDRARSTAERLGIARVVAVTFDPHPMAVLRPDHAPATITSLPERARLLGEAGADDVLVLPFTAELASWSPERFVEEVLVDSLHAGAVVVGENFRFGRRAAGDVRRLAELGEGHGFETVPLGLAGTGETWSSTVVRARLGEGDVDGAAEVLGRRPSVRGVVTRGDQRGRELGYPTANVDVGGMAAPGDGVYAGWLRVVPADGHDDTTWHPAAISVGTNPTFDGVRARRVESFVLGRDDLDLYDREVEVVFVARLRGMVAFGSVEELLDAMARDVADAERVLDAHPHP